jgi:hypothetical protein
MGCTNATCGISQLPITYKEKVVGLPIYAAKTLKRDYYDNDQMWKVAAWPIYGSYNDYGGIEKENIVCKDDWLKFLKGFHYYSSDIETALKGFRKADFASYMYEEPEIPSLFIVRKDVWNLCLKMGEHPQYEPEFNKWIENIIDVRDLSSKKDEMSATRALIKTLELNHMVPYPVISHIDLYLTHSKSISNDDVRLIGKELWDLTRVKFAMQSLRKTLHCQKRTSSQHTGWEDHVKFYNAIAKIANKKFKKEND